MDKNILFETESHLQGGILCFDEKFSDNDFQSFGLSGLPWNGARGFRSKLLS